MKPRLKVEFYRIRYAMEYDRVEYCADIKSKTLSPDEMDNIAERFDTLSRPESYPDESNGDIVNIVSVYGDSKASLKEQIKNALSDDYYLTFED